MTALIYNPITYVLAWWWLPFWFWFFPVLVEHRWPAALARWVRRGGIVSGFAFALVIPALFP
jgi:hypothetical protein